MMNLTKIDIFERAKIIRQDTMFVARMREAIKLGLERADSARASVDDEFRPVKFYSNSIRSQIGSSAAECADS